MRLHHVLGTAFAITAFLTSAAQATDALPSFTVDKTQTSVSGLSSGAFMAVQFHTAYSSEVMGAGIVAGGPYNCVFSNFGGISTCMQGIPNAGASYASAQTFAWSGQIDGLDHIKNSRVYIFHGTKDSTVGQFAVEATRAYYRIIGVPDQQIQYVDSVPSGHAFITPDFGNACGKTDSPYVNHCSVKNQNYDQASAILTHIYGALKPPADMPTGRLVAFDQKVFSEESSMMGPVGYLYVPQSCAQGATCRIHVAFHGCMQTPADIGDAYYSKTGYNRWADTNNMLILYPQAPSNVSSNPQHCWDWWGYTGPAFALKTSAQMSAVKRMIDHLSK